MDDFVKKSSFLYYTREALGEVAPVSYTHLDVYKRQGEDGASHQCCEDFALMRSIPGMTVICPADDVEALSLIHI